jgi:hypothetical protein
MRHKSSTPGTPSERLVRDIRRATSKQYSTEEKIRIVLDGLRGDATIAESLYYSWSKEFLEAGKRRLAGDTGNDTFVFANGFGNDRITDFTTGTALAHDTIDLRGLGFMSFADVHLHITNDALGYAVIHAGIDDITLTGVAKAKLQVRDVVFRTFHNGMGKAHALSRRWKIYNSRLSISMKVVANAAQHGQLSLTGNAVFGFSLDPLSSDFEIENDVFGNVVTAA